MTLHGALAWGSCVRLELIDQFCEGQMETSRGLNPAILLAHLRQD